MRFVKVLALLLCLILVILPLSACKDEEAGLPKDDTVYYTVKFSTAGGSAVADVKAAAGSKIKAPDNPVKEGYIFDGWRYDKGLWSFDINTVTSDLTLTAVWIDARSVFEYEVKDGEAVITKYDGQIEVLEIPTQLGGYPVVAVGDNAFYETPADYTRQITLGEHIRSIGAMAFYNSIDVKIYVEGEIEYVGEKAFYGCNKIESIKFGSGMESVPFEAFSGCEGLRSVVFSDTVSDIGENAFELCASLQTVTFYGSLKTIQDCAFESCESLEAIYFIGSEEEFDAIEISMGNDGNAAVVDAKLFFYSETQPEDSELQYWYYDTNGKIRIW